ncbi:MAG: PAS domain S-box protein [Pseudomonadota bacterium]|nr:PAS domain S-box protein [Pseudomonadota bacterium]
MTLETDTAASLRRSEALFRQTSELTATGCWEADLVSGETRWSAQIYRNLELDEADGPISIERFSAQVEPEYLAQVKEAWERAMSLGTPYDMEVVVRTAGGKRRWMRLVGSAHREGDVLVRLYGACQDITERKESAFEVERREDQLRALGDDLPDAGLFQLETRPGGASRITFLSSSLAALLGASPERGGFDAADFLERIDAPDRRRLLILGAAARGQMTPVDAEIQFNSPLGVRWLHVRGVPRVTQDGGCRWDGLVLDQTRRRDAERNERLRTQKLTAVLETAGDATFVVTHHDTVELANPAAERMFGASAGGLDGLAITALLPEWSRAPDGRRAPVDLAGVKRTGRTFPVTCTTTALEAEDRQVVVVRDQSETRGLEHRLRERGALLSEVQRLAGIGAWRYDLRDGTLALDEEFHRIHGTRADSTTLAADVRACMHPDDRAGMDALIHEAREQGGPAEKEFRVLHPEGQRFVRMRGELTFEDDGTPASFRGFCQDITERRQMEEDRRRLFDERERLAEILDATPDIVSMADATGRILYVNRAGRRFGRLGPDVHIEGLGLTIQGCHPEWAWRLLERVALPAARRDGVWVGESILGIGPQGEVPVAQTILAHRSASGEVERFSTIARDIRGQKRTERALAAARLRAEEANRAKSAFLANMSHELRTPLNAIIGFSDLLAQLAFGPLNARQADYVGHIVAGGRHLLSLVDDILDISKVEAGRLTLDLVETSIGPLLSALSAGMQPVAQRGGLVLDVSIAPGLPSMRIDVKRVRQILLNLISNACKFTPHGGRVRLEAVAVAQEMVLSVTDSGIGIGREDLQRVFDEFEQIASPNGRRMDGTGLGLALSRRLAELHGGRLDVESEIGRGSTFSLRLPIGASVAPPPTHALLVGHEPAVAARLGEQLEQAALHVDIVPSVEDACARLKRRTPGVLILDVGLRAQLSAQASLIREAARLAVPLVFLGGLSAGSEDDPLPVPATRWQAVARLRSSGVALPPLAGLRIWVFDIDQSLAALEIALREGGAAARRGSSLSGAVAFDADLVVHGASTEGLEPPLHATLPSLLVPAGLSAKEVADLVYGAMVEGVPSV